MNSEEAEKLRREVMTGEEPEVLVKVLDRLDAEVGELPLTEELGLRYATLRALQSALPLRSPLILEIIVQRLLPLCMQRSDNDNLKQNLYIYNCRELADEWLNSLDGALGTEARERATGYLLARLAETEKRAEVCWTVGQIGYRTEALAAALWEIWESGSENAAYPLRALAHLGLSPVEQDKCLAAALDSARERLTADVAAVLVAIPQAQTLAVLEEAWLGRPAAELEERGENLMMIFAAIGRSAEEPETADEACRLIQLLQQRMGRRLGRSLRLSGNGLPSIDSPRAAQLLAHFLTEHTESDEYDRWLVMHRLEECVLPRQLAALSPEILNEPEVVEVLQKALLQTGENLGPAATLPGDAKILALETALFIGFPEVERWLEAAVAHEQNPFLQHEIMEAFAVLKIDPLPEPLPLWITEEKDLGREKADNAELIRRLAASRVARSAESWNAFDLLSRPGLSREGAVMRDTAEALVTAAVFVGRNPEHRPAVIARLFDAVEHPATRAQLASGCQALAAVARRGWLDDQAVRLCALLDLKPTVPFQPHELAELVSAVVALPASVLPPATVERIENWGRERDDQLGETAIRAVIELRRFEANVEWLAPKLGLTDGPQGWVWTADAPGQSASSTYLVVQLYAQTPERFTTALCSVLTHEQWFERYDVVGALLNLVLRKSARLNQAVIEALLLRARQRQNSRQADPELLRQVALLVPERFAVEPWNDWVNDWLEDSRAALADALGETMGKLFPAAPDLRRRAAMHILILASDEQFAVRRAAHRALAKALPSTLSTFCYTLAESSDVQKRALAAEAWGWMPSLTVRDEIPFAVGFWRFDLDELGDRLSHDASKTVRAVAEASAEARCRRELARQYHLQLVSRPLQTNLDMLSVWKFGRALAAIADDEAIHQLRHYLETAETAPSARYRLFGVLKEAEKAWRAGAKDISKPTIGSSVRTETVEGYVHFGERQIAVQCTLWCSSGPSPESDRCWGADATTREPSESIGLSGVLGEELKLSTTDRPTAFVCLTSVNLGGYLTFTGMGEYPTSRTGRQNK